MQGDLPTTPRNDQSMSYVQREAAYEKRRKVVGGEWSSLMDRMQETAGSRGNFFVSIGGDKDVLVGYTYHGSAVRKDTRTLILIESIRQDNPNEQLFVVITADGVKGIKFNKELGDEVPRDAESSFRELRFAGSHEEEERDSYERWRRELTLPDIVRRMTDGEKMFVEQDEHHVSIGFSEKDNLVRFGMYRPPNGGGMNAFEADNASLAPIEYSVIPIEGMDLVERAFKASYASAELHKDSQHSPKAESPAEISRREDLSHEAKVEALKKSSERAGKVLAIVQEGLPPEPIGKMLRR